MPKAVYRSGCRVKHSHPRCDSNPGPLTPQSDALTTRPLPVANTEDHAGGRGPGGYSPAGGPGQSLRWEIWHPSMFQWDAVDTSPDLGGQNVLKTFEMAIRHNRRTT